MGYKPQQNPTKIIEEIAQINDKKLARTTLQIQKKTEARSARWDLSLEKRGSSYIHLIYNESLQVRVEVTFFQKHQI